MLDKVEEQKELMKKIYDDDIKGNKKVAIEKDCKPIFNMDLSLYGEEIIDKDFQKLQNKLDNFTKDLKSIQVHKFNYQITSAALFVVISSIGIAGYWIRREYIPLISSILLLLFAAPIFAMAGLETTYTFLSIDFCSTIGNSIISGITPSEDTGLGSYLSCPSKETMRTLSTAIYQYMIDFDTIYNYVKFTLENNTFFDMLKIGNDKRNNTYFMELRENLTLLNLTSENPEEEKRNNQTRDNMIHGVSLFIDLNYILAGLLSMTSCFTAKNIINYIE